MKIKAFLVAIVCLFGILGVSTVKADPRCHTRYTYNFYRQPTCYRPTYVYQSYPTYYPTRFYSITPCYRNVQVYYRPYYQPCFQYRR